MRESTATHNARKIINYRIMKWNLERAWEFVSKSSLYAGLHPFLWVSFSSPQWANYCSNKSAHSSTVEKGNKMEWEKEVEQRTATSVGTSSGNIKLSLGPKHKGVCSSACAVEPVRCRIFWQFVSWKHYKPCSNLYKAQTLSYDIALDFEKNGFLPLLGEERFSRMLNWLSWI